MEPLDKLSKKILELWLKDKTTTEIGEMLGMTKNSISGRIHRLRMKGHIAPRRNPERYQPPSYPPKIKNRRIIRQINKGARQAPELALPVPKKPRVAHHEKTLMQLTINSCRYIIYMGEKHDTLYCGAPKERGAYCNSHASLCYIKAKDYGKVALKMARNKQ